MTADDYTVINISGQLLTKAQVFEAIKSGDLKYDQLENNDIQVRVYGDTAVLTGRTAQKGQFKGKDISGQTRFTRVYLKQHGKLHNELIDRASPRATQCQWWCNSRRDLARQSISRPYRSPQTPHPHTRQSHN